MPRLVSVSWWERVARRAFGYQEHRVLALEDSMRVVADLANLPPEWYFDAGWVPFKSDALSQVNVVAQFQSVGIWNPPSSGWVVVIEEAQHNSGIDLNLCVGAVQAAPGVVISGVQIPRDTRYLTPAATVPLSDTASRFTSIGAQTFSRSAAAQITSNVKSHIVRATNTAGNWNRLEKLWQVLGPGGFLAVEGIVANQAITSAVFIGYAVRLER